MCRQCFHHSNQNSWNTSPKCPENWQLFPDILQEHFIHFICGPVLPGEHKNKGKNRKPLGKDDKGQRVSLIWIQRTAPSHSWIPRKFQKWSIVYTWNHRLIAQWQNKHQAKKLYKDEDNLLLSKTDLSPYLHLFSCIYTTSQLPWRPPWVHVSYEQIIKSWHIGILQSYFRTTFLQTLCSSKKYAVKIFLSSMSSKMLP